ncbi:MAG TPA: ATP-binding protein, partial [Anaerolineae bacterium]|nr:ATP-binding protein [Anaerolineae bacterium]
MSTATKTAQKWIVLGDATDRQGRVHDVGWPIQDMYTHGSIYGTTGSGKTTLMNNLIQQLIMSGCITLVVTPHADMIFDSKDGLLARMAPKYLHRVILLDPSQPYLPQLSLVPAGLSPSKTTETLLARIRSMEPSSWEDNTMMRQVLTHAVRALVAADGTTMMSTIDRFLKDDAFRDAITNRIPDMARETREFWEDVAEKLAEAKTDNTRARYFDPAQRRIDGFMTNDPLKWSLALPPMHPQATVNLHEQLQQAGPLLILVPLLEHKIGPVAMRMLGNLIVDLTVSACISRPPEKRVPTLLFIDELPNVIGTANIGHLLARIFAEFRKFALGTFVAFQSPDQLPSKLRKDIESLANTKIVMKV